MGCARNFPVTPPRILSSLRVLHHETSPQKNTICLWCDKDALDAARFYAATFPHSEVIAASSSAALRTRF